MVEQRFSIGYALAPKKQQSFIQESLVDLARPDRGASISFQSTLSARWQIRGRSTVCCTSSTETIESGSWRSSGSRTLTGL
ncbi:hypothetical protein ACFX12_009705 [Malus domestica]